MFGSDQFNFETPNVIDPGDLPPSQPSRVRSNGSENSNTESTHDDGSSGSSSGGNNNDYRHERDSTARLLRDIGDLDLTPADVPVSPRPYDPYDDDEDDEDVEGGTGGTGQHSLPTVEEARMYATRLLKTGRSPPKGVRIDHHPGKPRMLKPPSPFLRTKSIPIDNSDEPNSSSRHLVRKTFYRHLCRFGIFLAVLGVTMGIGYAIVGRSRRNNAQVVTSTGGGTTTSRSRSGSRFLDVTTFLTENSISDVDDLKNSNSPQSKAAKWIADFDPLQRDVPNQYTVQSDIGSRFLQRYVLAVLFYSLGGTDSSKKGNDDGSWKRDYNFMSATDECSWYEETIIPDHVQEETALGVTCDVNLQVRNLYMPANDLKGSIPTEIALLTRLDLLAMPNNQIEGRLPSEMKALKNLVYFDIKYNQVSGFVPEWIGDFSELEVLGLSNNQLAGEVPPSFGTLGRLKTLAIDDNALTGSLDFAQHLTNLEYFWADRNLMTGTVDETFFANNDVLRQLDLSFNDLKPGPTKIFPTHLLRHRTLNVLDLSDTSLEGMTFPTDDEWLTSQPNKVLHFLSLRRSGLAGSIPNAISNLQALKHLDLVGNSLTGLFPNELGEVVGLNYLFLGENPFQANQRFPPFLSQLINLRELSMSDVSMSGDIETWISYLQDLRLLDLSKNNLGGPIPQQVWDLPQLSFLLVHDNQLTGTVPSSIKNAEKLQVVSLYQNQLSNGDDGGSLDHFCTSNPDMDILAVDCALKCSDQCCSQGCCEEGDDDCFRGKVSTYLTWYEGMWEFNYTRPSYAYDPAILAEAAVAQVVTDQFEDGYYEEDEGNYYDGEDNYEYDNRRGDWN